MNVCLHPKMGYKALIAYCVAYCCVNGSVFENNLYDPVDYFNRAVRDGIVFG